MIRSRTFQCKAVMPRVWHGRYARVPGDTTTFHIRYMDGRWWPVVVWATEDGIATCPMVDEGEAEVLVDAVNHAKRELGAWAEGGAFLVNEHGRVLVPASDGRSTDVMVAAECSGPLRFEDSFVPGTTFDLYDDRALTCGDRWDRPYVGIPHNLSAAGKLYLWQEDDSGGYMLSPPDQDTRLISALRTLRPYGPVRFLVGMGGLVITKLPPLWKPRYVGRIDLTRWFSKEVLA